MNDAGNCNTKGVIIWPRAPNVEKPYLFVKQEDHIKKDWATTFTIWIKKTAITGIHYSLPGLGPNNQNTLINSLNTCQIFKLLTNISDSVHIKQF
jgi:hypothetical protein